MKKVKKMICIFVAAIMLITTLSFSYGCAEKKEEETVWWKDHKNILVVVGDKRSPTEDYFTLASVSPEINFEYNFYNDTDTTVELIPKIRVFYKNQEKEVFPYIYERQQKYIYAESISEEEYEITNFVVNPGIYKVDIFVFASEEDCKIHNSWDAIICQEINIKINYKGEENT